MTNSPSFSKTDQNALNPQKVAELLTQSTRQLDEATLTALVSARQNALKRQLMHAPIFAFQPAGQRALSWVNRLISPSAQPWIAMGLAAGLLAAALFAGTGYWQHIEEQQINELDVAILTDELPIEVFVD
ncbi:MAG: DUF3619 family protein [Gallionella sp.]|jgi:hypothetical protein